MPRVDELETAGPGMSRRCAANATEVGAEVCPFAPTHEVVLHLPAGHRYGLAGHPSELSTLTCAVHLPALERTVAELELEAVITVLPRHE